MPEDNRNKSGKKETLKNVRPHKTKRNIFELDDGKGELATSRPLDTRGTRPSAKELAERDYRIRVTNKIGRARRVSASAVSTVITVAIVVAVLFGVCRMIFSVSTISVQGNSYYSAYALSEACGVDYGDFILFFDTDAAEERILRSCPHVGQVQVLRELPGTVKINVSEAKIEYYTELYGDYVLLSDKLRVIDTVSQESKTEGLISLVLPNVTRALDGESIELGREGDADKIRDIIAASRKISEVAKIVSFDFSDIHNALVICEGDYTLKLGEWKDAEVKFAVAEKILSDSLVKDANGAEIDLSYPKQASVKPK